MAMTINRERALQLAPNFSPDVDNVLTKNGLAAFGVPGSGKSNFLLQLVKQMARYLVPMVLLDTENEYAESLQGCLPNGLFIDAASARNLSAKAILTSGQQVVVNLTSWDDAEKSAWMISSLIDGLFAVASGQKQSERTPCAILMDEAAYWLPRRTKSIAYFEKETRAMLLSTFERLGSRGRKYGLVPFYFTQYVSQIEIETVKGCGHFVLMQQRFPNDLARYGEFVDLSKEQTSTIRHFQAGEALILGPHEEVWTRFYADESHTSVTPSVQAAIVKYSRSLVEKQTGVAEKVAYGQKKREVFALLAQNPTLGPSELASRAGCGMYTAAHYKRAYLDQQLSL